MGSGRIAPPFLIMALDGGKCSVSHPAYFIPEKGGPRTHWIGGWVCLRASMDTLDKKKICPCPESNPRNPSHSPSLYWLSYPSFHGIYRIYVYWTLLVIVLISYLDVLDLIFFWSHNKVFVKMEIFGAVKSPPSSLQCSHNAGDSNAKVMGLEFAVVHFKIVLGCLTCVEMKFQYRGLFCMWSECHMFRKKSELLQPNCSV
jgi:hypothetical protein